MKRSIFSRRNRSTCPKFKVHYVIRDRSHRATKFKTTKFNSGNLSQLFTKISTHENNPLYGITPTNNCKISSDNLWYDILSISECVKRFDFNTTVYSVVPEGCSRNGISRLQVLWPGYILSPQQQSLSCSPSAERTEFCETGTSHTVEEWRKTMAITDPLMCVYKCYAKTMSFHSSGLINHSE